MFKKKRFVIGLVVLVVAVGYLGFMGFQGSAMYYYRIPELLEMGEEAYDQGLRVSGVVLAGSIVREPGTLNATFTVVEEGETLDVEYTGVIPDTFKDEADVVIEGNLLRSGIFDAQTILMKCPSKYEAEE
jgi:cytochrome c-type biogenesis protein CcmE